MPILFHFVSACFILSYLVLWYPPYLILSCVILCYVALSILPCLSLFWFAFCLTLPNLVLFCAASCYLIMFCFTLSDFILFYLVLFHPIESCLALPCVALCYLPCLALWFLALLHRASLPLSYLVLLCGQEGQISKQLLVVVVALVACFLLLHTICYLLLVANTANAPFGNSTAVACVVPARGAMGVANGCKQACKWPKLDEKKQQQNGVHMHLLPVFDCV